MTSKSVNRRGSKNVYSHRRGGNGASFKYKISYREAALLLPGDLFQKQQEQEAKPLTRPATMEDTVTPVNPQLLSFLQRDDSFLCPWNWGPTALQNEASSSSKKTMQQYMHFQPGSFLARQVI